MQVASTLWPDIKSQKISEYRFRLKTDQVKFKTTPNPLRTGRTLVFRQEEAQDSPWKKLGAVGAPGPSADHPGRPSRPVGPTASTKPRVASLMDA